MTVAALETQGLAVRFHDHLALADVTFAVPEGAFMAVVGPNGSGKSTLIRVLLGIVPPSAGAVRLYGRLPSEVPPEWLGYVPQLKTLDRTFPALAVELVATGLRRCWPGLVGAGARREALAALEAVGAAHLADRPSGRLSGGELQRVYLARGLVRRPRLVVLDEPATGIDVAGEADMYRFLDAYHRANAATIVMVTHDLEAAHHHASHVLVLNQRQISFGSPDAALGEASLRRAFGHVGHAHAMHLGLGDG
jgi:zinc transport system ATP-binding protein